MEGGKAILPIFREHNDQIATLIGADFAPSTLERYQTCLKHTRDFIKWEYQAEDRQWEVVDGFDIPIKVTK
jgi:hypothetical protein